MPFKLVTNKPAVQKHRETNKVHTHTSDCFIARDSTWLRFCPIMSHSVLGSRSIQDIGVLRSEQPSRVSNENGIYGKEDHCSIEEVEKPLSSHDLSSPAVAQLDRSIDSTV
jgi:hypothetical protein